MGEGELSRNATGIWYFWLFGYGVLVLGTTQCSFCCGCVFIRVSSSVQRCCTCGTVLADPAPSVVWWLVATAPLPPWGKRQAACACVRSRVCGRAARAPAPATAWAGAEGATSLRPHSTLGRQLPILRWIAHGRAASAGDGWVGAWKGVAVRTVDAMWCARVVCCRSLGGDRGGGPSPQPDACGGMSRQLSGWCQHALRRWCKTNVESRCRVSAACGHGCHCNARLSTHANSSLWGCTYMWEPRMCSAPCGGSHTAVPTV